MKKLGTRQISTFVSLVLVVTVLFSGSAFASEARIINGSICTRCGTGNVLIYKNGVPPNTIGLQQRCPDYPYGTDLNRKALTEYSVYCDYCQVIDGTSPIQWECHGGN